MEIKNNSNKTAWDIVSKSLYQELLEEEKNEVYPKESIWPDLKKEIQSHGYVCEIQNTAEHICNNNPDEFRDIIMKYYKICTINKEKSFLISCLFNKKNVELTPLILNEFEKHHNDKMTLFNDMVMNFLIKAHHIKFKDLYIKVLKNKQLKHNIISVFEGIESLKIKEVEDILVESLKDEELIGGEGNYMKNHILRSLSKYNDPGLLYLFEEYLSDDDRDVRNICKKAIEKLQKISITREN